MQKTGVWWKEWISAYSDMQLHLYGQYGINKRWVRVMATGEHNIFKCPEILKTFQVVDSLTTQLGLLATGGRNMICSVSSGSWATKICLARPSFCRPSKIEFWRPQLCFGLPLPLEIAFSPFFFSLRHIAAEGSETEGNKDMKVRVGVFWSLYCLSGEFAGYRCSPYHS